MGKVVKGIGKGIGGIAKAALPIASAVLPGPWGAVAGAASSMIEGAKANKQAQAVEQQMGGMAQQQAQGFNQYYMPLLDAYAQMSGYQAAQPGASARPGLRRGAGGQTPAGFNPNYSPYGAVSATPYGDASQNPYTGTSGSAKYNQIAESTDESYDQAADQLSADMLHRGFTGASSGLNSAMGDLRRDEARELAGARRDLSVAGEQERFKRNAMNVDESFRRNAMNEDEKFRRIAGMIPMMNGAGQQAMGNLQGLGANYASRAGNMGQSIASLGGALAQTGVLGKWMKKRTQSTSAGTTTANAAPKPPLAS